MSLNIKTGRFGTLNIQEDEVIQIPRGILGFPDQTRYCLVDPGDETLILWMQSLDHPELAFPILEPRVFMSQYVVRLSASELRELHLDNVREAAVFSILTIPENVTEMTANLKAPLVINLKNKIAKQVVLQENEYNIKHMMFKELRVHLMTLEANKSRVAVSGNERPTSSPVRISSLPPSLSVVSLESS